MSRVPDSTDAEMAEAFRCMAAPPSSEEMDAEYARWLAEQPADDVTVEARWPR